jgi:ribosomal-protein-alanine N-acetyltransferase
VNDIFKDLPIIETPRLILRKMRLTDADDLFAYARDPEVSRYLVWTPHQNIEETRGYINYVNSQYDKGLLEDWGIEYRQSHTFIGTAGYFFWDVPHSRAEIHYCLAKDYWHKGLMPEALRAILRFGFERMQLNRIEAKCFPENLGSEKVLKKIGMQFEGIMRQGVYAKGSFHDMKCYAVLSSDKINDPSPHSSHE